MTDKVSLSGVPDLATKSWEFFEKLKKNLVAQPDVAAKNLADLLEKLAKMFEAVNGELNKYLSISFAKNNDSQIAEARKKLIELEGLSVTDSIGKFKVHCTEIDSIYHIYLDRWFTRAFGSNYNSTKKLFYDLLVQDRALEYIIGDLQTWLEKHAQIVHDMLDNEEYDQAIMKLREDGRSVRPARDELKEAIKKLYGLEADFIGLAKTIT